MDDGPVVGVMVFAMILTLAGSALMWTFHDHDDATPVTAPMQVTVDMASVAYAPAIITVTPGSTVTWVNKDPFAHTVTPTDKGLWGTEGSGDAFDAWLGEGASWSHTFDEVGTYHYYCIPHASQDGNGDWQGMVATVIVADEVAEGVLGPQPALPVDVPEIGRDPHDVPAPLSRAAGAVTIDLEAVEVVAEMADGTTFSYWTFNGTVPGPMMRVVQGDQVTLRLHNLPSSSTGHNIDLHAVTGPGGGAALTNVEPGETATFTFEARNPGLFVYHCAFQDPALHVAHGMYGLILVEPPGGLPPVDQEYYIVQGDFYSPYTASDTGHHPHDPVSADAEDPTFVVFNGRVGSLAERPLQAAVGDSVRMFVGVGGPNAVSSFHVIGEIFDRVYDEGDVISPPLESVQTTLIPAGGAVIVEFDVEVPGDYFLVDHSLNRLHKGAFGVLHVTGDDDPSVYRSGT